MGPQVVSKPFTQQTRQLCYEDSGRGDAVVLMPGWGGSIADLGRRPASAVCGTPR